MKLLKYYILGIVFGILLTKAEIVSWLRIYEMFHFESFHMFGVIGSAVLLGALMVFISKKLGFKNAEGQQFTFGVKEKSFYKYIIGGSIFGLGWALTGACPGPMFALVGNGILVMIPVILSALLGTFVYGLIRHKLPH